MTVEVRAVASRGERRLFRDLPARLLGDDPAFVPMLDVTFRAIFDRRNPFWTHAESREWLAWRGGEAVGRIGACDDRSLREAAGCGAVGFFDAVDDDDVALSLFRAAETWLRDRGYARARGPLSYSIHDTAAVLVEGFATPPTIDTTWNPAYYARLWEADGFSGVQDMVALERDGHLARARGNRFAERARRKGVVIRPLDMSRFEEELTTATEIYNVAWENNWGHVPITAEEFAFKARDMKAVLDQGLIAIAECEGRVVGLTLAMPDLNVAIKKSRGRILPWGWLRMLRAKHCGRARCMLLGVIPGFRRRGIEAALLSEIMAHFDRQYSWAEASWVLADNAEMLNGLKLYDMVPYKRWRMYEKDLKEPLRVTGSDHRVGADTRTPRAEVVHRPVIRGLPTRHRHEVHALLARRLDLAGAADPAAVRVQEQRRPHHRVVRRIASLLSLLAKIADRTRSWRTVSRTKCAT